MRTPVFSVSELLGRRAGSPSWDLGIMCVMVSLFKFPPCPGNPLSFRHALSLLNFHTERVSIAPLDGHTTFPDFHLLVSEFNIPCEFRSERDSAVTHSFGNVLNDDGSECK